MERYDLIVLGGGPAGERSAIQAARAGKRTALVERHFVVGGTGVNWGAIPSKTLRESALFVRSLTLRRLDAIRCELAGEITIADFMHRERETVRRELEMIERALAHYGVEVVRGHGRFADPHTVAVSGLDGAETARLRGDVVIVAVGSSPNRPAHVPFDDDTVFDSATILGLPRLPRSLLVLGAGVIGVEYASIFAALGIAVTLADTRDRLLPYLDREIADILLGELAALGIEYRQGVALSEVERLPGGRGRPPRVACRFADGECVTADALLYCVGRDGNTADLGLAAAGLAANARGLLEVNDDFQTAVPHIYAVGDVIGYPALASTSMEQGRQAARHAFQIPGPHARTATLPFAIYSIPEVSYIGATTESLHERGVPHVAGRARYDYNPRGQISGETGGRMKLLFEAGSLKLLGAHICGFGASELIHVGQAFLNAQATARTIAETLFNYPTLSDLYRHAALEAVMAEAKRHH